MDKKNWEAYFDAIKKQDWESARMSLQNLLQAERNNPQLYLKIGDIYQRTGDSVNAVSAYHQAARLMHSRGFTQKALALYKIILRLEPRNALAISRSEALMTDLEAAKTPQTSVTVPGTPESEGPEECATRPPEQSVASIRSGLFSGMPEEEILQLLQKLQLKSFSGNEKVVEEGDSGDSIYIIKSGRAKVIAHLLGREIELALLETGDMFGEVAFLTGRPRTASLVAEGPLEVYEAGRLELEALLSNNPSLLQKIEDIYLSRVQDTIRKVKA
ncbi:MAG: cyclic nucleotide-binding domain-containing protein [Nitrospirota bacterium]|nr:cyclic nucleotide-binding domain-containing protein [Nitrospirota bacterium]